MPVYVRAEIDRFEGWAKLSFPYDKETIATVKQYPGAIWNPDVRSWFAPTNLLPHLPVNQQTTKRDFRYAPIPEEIGSRLREYQLEGADYLIGRRGALLTMDPRTGKTPTTIAALCALMASGEISCAVVLYPSSVLGEWESQLSSWANLTLFPLQGFSALDSGVLHELQGAPWLVLGCHYDILAKRGACLLDAIAGRKFVLVADEVQHCKNRKIERTRILWELAHHTDCVAAWGVTGTPMRNRPRDLWALFELIQPGSMGRGYWNFAKRYCNAHQDDLGHWDDKGRSNEEELAARLAAVSYRKTRAEVAAWLPKSDRKVIFCATGTEQLKKYKKIERYFAKEIGRAIDDADPIGADGDVLRQLVLATSEAKIDTAVERAVEHKERGVKVVVFAHFHETLQLLDKALDVRTVGHFCAGGWMTPTKRREIIERWRSTSYPSVLIVNTQSSGVGIDLADAEVALFLELEWVPADLKQAEDRIQDVHKGKRRTPPLYEYLLVKGTVDESMAATLLHKISGLQKVVGRDIEAGGIASTLRGAGVVDSARLGLDSTDTDVVKAALRGLRDRWISGDAGDTTAEVLAQDFSDVWEDEEENENAEDDVAAA